MGLKSTILFKMFLFQCYIHILFCKTYHFKYNNNKFTILENYKIEKSTFCIEAPNYLKVGV